MGQLCWRGDSIRFATKGRALTRRGDSIRFERKGTWCAVRTVKLPLAVKFAPRVQVKLLTMFAVKFVPFGTSYGEKETESLHRKRSPSPVAITNCSPLGLQDGHWQSCITRRALLHSALLHYKGRSNGEKELESLRLKALFPLTASAYKGRSQWWGLDAT